jgi:hypothetical protein
MYKFFLQMDLAPSKKKPKNSIFYGTWTVILSENSILAFGRS